MAREVFNRANVVHGMQPTPAVRYPSNNESKTATDAPPAALTDHKIQQTEIGR